MRYEQLAPREALREYCDWLLAVLPRYESSIYPLFYAGRCLLYASKLLKCPEYAEIMWPFFDRYVAEQLPNGAFNAKFLARPTAEMSAREIEALLRTGQLNLADGGSNVHALIQAAAFAAPERRERYLAAANKWLTNWVPIWGLPTGAYGNGFWYGHKLNGPYSMAMNVCTAFAAYVKVAGDGDGRMLENAENFARFQLEQGWHECGVPIRFDNYPVPSCDSLISDYCRSFYLLEALLWTAAVSPSPEFKALVKSRLDQWLDADLLKRWPENGSYFNQEAKFHPPAGFRDSTDGTRFYWRAAKCNGLCYLFSLYLRHLGDRADLRERVEQGARYLSNPLDARMVGVAADNLELYISVQATGFAGLTLIEAIEPDFTFNCFK